ncbi:hypothetical protein [Algibacter mikhailovii]|uniref:hypothetical protein n=1 Tax=Algibacter mikhailovii TaxID=425498 RepID=UPI0024941133|nr:hypothetical protein [Algibacter mikhailovii]
MNTIKTFLFIVLISFNSPVEAKTTLPPNDFTSVTQQIETLLKASETTIYDDIVVAIKFKIDDNNKITVISNNSNSEGLTRFIKKRLNEKELYIDQDNNYRFYTISIQFLSTIY